MQPFLPTPSRTLARTGLRLHRKPRRCRARCPRRQHLRPRWLQLRPWLAAVPPCPWPGPGARGRQWKQISRRHLQGASLARRQSRWMHMQRWTTALVRQWETWPSPAPTTTTSRRQWSWPQCPAAAARCSGPWTRPKSWPRRTTGASAPARAARRAWSRTAPFGQTLPHTRPGPMALRLCLRTSPRPRATSTRSSRPWRCWHSPSPCHRRPLWWRAGASSSTAPPRPPWCSSRWTSPRLRPPPRRECSSARTSSTRRTARAPRPTAP
mmetsp:Transcript_2675/g.10635  ORF Transcript_2675/g.10635 Transcript_2675/m.10635 type:complete len:267 (-) Transcript_2675:2143-2943(-)